MKTLTFCMDVEINSNEDWIESGTVVEVAKTWRNHDGYTPVIIKEALSFTGKPVKFESEEVIYIDNDSFLEFR